MFSASGRASARTGRCGLASQTMTSTRAASASSHSRTAEACPSVRDACTAIHVPDFTTLGLDPHTLQFQAAGGACGLGDLWQMQWWWPAGLAQP